VRHGKIFSENLRLGARHAPPTRARPKLAKTDSGTRAMQRKQAMQKCATSKKNAPTRLRTEHLGLNTSLR